LIRSRRKYSRGEVQEKTFFDLNKEKEYNSGRKGTKTFGEGKR
jgi:hypothetical protein